MISGSSLAVDTIAQLQPRQARASQYCRIDITAIQLGQARANIAAQQLKTGGQGESPLAKPADAVMRYQSSPHRAIA